MANPRSVSRTRGREAVIWAAKISVSFLGILAFGAGARAVVPIAAEALASAFPGFKVGLRSGLSGPYLFLAVHFIILVIWKLSDQKQRNQHLEQCEAEETTTEVPNPTKIKSLSPSSAAGLLHKPSPEIWPDEILQSTKAVDVPAPDSDENSLSGASCLTTESSERSGESSAFWGPKRVQPVPMGNITMAEEDEVIAPAETENESVQATWPAISETVHRAATTTTTTEPAAGPSSLSHDELNRRFEEFIKKNHEQIRLFNSPRRR